MVTIGTTKYDPTWDDDRKCMTDGYERHPKWDDSKYLQWIKEIWHVEIEEQARHLWPGQWTISGEWEDERALYKKYEKEWDEKCSKAWQKKYEAWKKEHPDKSNDDLLYLQVMADGDGDGILYNCGEDYFHWNVVTPGWSMHRNGTWQKMLIDLNDWTGKTRDQYPGIFNSYKHACKTLANYCDLVAPRFALGELADYEKHLKDFVQNYDYTR